MPQWKFPAKPPVITQFILCVFKLLKFGFYFIKTIMELLNLGVCSKSHLSPSVCILPPNLCPNSRSQADVQDMREVSVTQTHNLLAIISSSWYRRQYFIVEDTL